MKAIYVLRDAWVLVGDEDKRDDEGRLYLTNASVVRVWGTSKGLGELAHSGPLADTKLDPVGVVIIEPHDLKFTIPCNKGAWAN